VVCAGTAGAQPAGYPNKPIRLVIGFAPAGAADFVARSIERCPGQGARPAGPSSTTSRANGSSIAAEIVAKSPADGYTLADREPEQHSVNPALNPKLAYTPADLVPVTKMTTSPLVLAVNPATGIKS